MNAAIARDLSVTSEICGVEMSDAAARVLVDELGQYEPRAVHGALARCRRELTGRLTLAAIIERLDDGRPGAEEAWALLPKTEDDSAVISSDMRVAMGPALALLGDGEVIAARMAFLELYRRRVAMARAEHEPVSWFVTLGHDPAGRVAPLVDAVKLGRIPKSQAVLAAGGAAEKVIAAIGDSTQRKIEGPAPDRESVPEMARELIAKMGKTKAS